MHYRPEIDGLRAIAVIPVILFHAGFEQFRGGFVGVDIFFVISGYLITTIILTELETGKFSLQAFYARRARRVLPALVVIILVSVPFAALWLMPSDLREFANSLFAVLGFSSNIFFWQKTFYFSGGPELKPLLHTWSLGVEEQFYLLFPLFLMLAWRWGRARIVMLLAIASLLSLGLAEYAVSRKPAAAFYLLPTRGWELMLGACAAFYLVRKDRAPLPLALSQLLSIAGLGLIAFGILAFDKDIPFPGVHALVPTIGAGLLLLFAVPGTCAWWLLSHRVPVGIGLVSYSAYLWHQPILAFARHRSFAEPSSILVAGLVFLTFGLSYLTWRYIEQPFRQQHTVTNGVMWTFSFSSALVISLCAVALHLSPLDSHNRLKHESSQLYRLHTCLFDSTQTFDTLLQNDCDSVQATARQATFKQSRLTQTYVLYGDSVAAHLYPGLVTVANEHPIIQLTGTSCRAIRIEQDQRCSDFYDWFVDDYVPHHDLDGIVISSSWLKTYDRLGDNAFRAKLKGLFEKLRGNRVVVYSQPASLSIDVQRYVYKLEHFEMVVPGTLEVEANSLARVNAALAEESSLFGFHFVDASQAFCSELKCVVEEDGRFYFLDEVHLTLAGSVRLAEMTKSALSGREG